MKSTHQKRNQTYWEQRAKNLQLKLKSKVIESKNQKNIPKKENRLNALDAKLESLESKHKKLKKSDPEKYKAILNEFFIEALQLPGTDIEMLRYLISEGVDVNTIDNEGNTPLYLAARNKDLEAISFLLENGANPDQSNEQGVTAAHLIKQNKEEMFLNEQTEKCMEKSRIKAFNRLQIDPSNIQLSSMLSSFIGHYNIENFKKSKATSVHEFIQECQTRAINDEYIEDKEQILAFEKFTQEIKEDYDKTIKAELNTKHVNAEKTVTVNEFKYISSKINNDILTNHEFVPSDSKLNSLLNSFRQKYGEITLARKATAPNHLETIEACRKAAISELSVKNRIGGVLARAGSSQTDIDKFNKIISNIASGKENLLEGVQAKPSKRTIRTMLGSAKKAISSFSIPGRNKPKSGSREK